MDERMTRTWDLVRRAKGGDRDATERLIARYYNRVRRAVHARIGPRLRARLETEDILLPAFAKAFQHLDRFEMLDERSLMNWLAEHARRQLLDAVDRENAQKRSPEGPILPIDAGCDSSAAGLQVPDPATAPIDRVMRDEHEAAIGQCLERLPEHYREVIKLRDYDGLEWNDIAVRLGKNTDSAARELHRRALLSLTQLLYRRGIRPDGA